MNNRIILMLALGFTISCNAQKNETIMAEKYDFELMRKVKKETGSTHAVIKRGDTAIYIGSMVNSGAFLNEYPPAPAMYFIQKSFYPDGELESKRKFIGEHLSIDESIYFDKQGNITKVDEDKKFGKTKLDYILKFIEKEGWVDLKTGKGRSEIVFFKGEYRGYIKNGVFILAFQKGGIDKMEYPVWYITINATPENNFYKTTYQIHGDTGEVLEKKSEQNFPIE